MKAIVFGATGKTGEQIVKSLLKVAVPSSVFARDVKKANDMFKSDIETEGVSVYEGDLTRYEDGKKL